MAIDFTFSPEIEQVRLKVRQFMDDEVRPAEEKAAASEDDRGAWLTAIIDLRKAAHGDNQAMVASDPTRLFLPKYMAHHGWVGLYLDLGTVDWTEVEELVTDAYLLTAPKTLARNVARSPGS